MERIRKKRVRKHNVTSETELKNVFLQKWSNIQIEFTKTISALSAKKVKGSP